MLSKKPREQCGYYLAHKFPVFILVNKNDWLIGCLTPTARNSVQAANAPILPVTDRNQPETQLSFKKVSKTKKNSFVVIIDVFTS